MKYDAFISYSHSADGRLAPAVQSGLQRLARPWYRRRALRVFRDETGLSVNPHLWNSIADAMGESRYFVLLASPDAAGSPWVNHEIEHWLTAHSPETLLIVLTDGTLVWDAELGGFDPDQSSALPTALTGLFVDEPRHLDMRWARTDDQLDVRHSRFRGQIATLAAPIHGVAREDLEGEDVRLHRRALRLAWGATIALVVLTLCTAFASLLAVRNADAATQRERARVKAQETADEATRRAGIADTLANRAQGDLRRARVGLSTVKAAKRTADASRKAAEGASKLATMRAEQARIIAEQRSIEAEAARVEAADARSAANDLRDQSDRLATLNAAAQRDLTTARADAADARRQVDVALAQAQTALESADNALVLAKRKTLEAKSVELALQATEPDRLHGDLQLALLLGREAARLDEQTGAHSPTVRDALLQLELETSRGLRRFLEIPDTSGVGGPAPIVVMRNGRVAYGSLTTNHIVVFDAGSSHASHDIDAGGPVDDVALGADDNVLVARIVSDAGSSVRMWNLGAGGGSVVLCAGGCGLTVGPGGHTIAVTGPTGNLFVDGDDPGTRIPFVGTLGVGDDDVGPPPPPGGPSGPTAVRAQPADPPSVDPPGPGAGGSAVSPFSSDGRWVIGRAPDLGNGLVVWDLAHGANRVGLDVLVGGHVDHAAFDASGSALAVSVDGASIARVELGDSLDVGPATAVGATVETVAAASNGAVAAITLDGRVVYAGLSSWEWSPSVPTSFTTLAFSPRGAVLAVGNEQARFLTLLDTTDAGLTSSARVVGSLAGAGRAWFSTDETVAFVETVDLGESNASDVAALTVLALGRPANGPIAAIAPTIVQVVDGRYRQFELTPDATLLVAVGDRADVFRLRSESWVRTSAGLPVGNVTAQSWGTLAGGSRMLADTALDHDGSVVAVTRDGFGAVWDARDFAPGAVVAGPPPNPEPPPFDVASVISPDLRLVARSLGTGIELVDRVTGALERTLHQPGNDIVVGIRFSPSGSYVLGCTGTPQTCEHTLVWRTADGAFVAQLVGVAAVSGDDTTVAHFDADAGRIEVFTAAALQSHAAPFRTIAVDTFPLADTPALTLDGDGSRLAFTNGWIHFVWETADGTAVVDGVGVLPGADAGASVRAALSTDGLVLAVQGGDGGVQLWDLGAHPAMRGRLPATLHASELVLNADGSMLATDNPVRVWDTQALRQTGPTFLDAKATTLRFTSGSGTLVVGLGEGPDAAELFTLDPRQLLDDACRLAGRDLTPDEWKAYGLPLPFTTGCP